MKKAWKVIRWIVLVSLVIAIVLMLTKPSRPAPPIPEAHHSGADQGCARKASRASAKACG